MKYGIVIDSGCDLLSINQWTTDNIFFTRVPLKLEIGEKEFIDDETLDVADFMRQMADFPGKTGSAAPSPDEWYNAFTQSDCTFALTISGTISGSISSARSAKQLLMEREPDKKVYILDSLSAGPEISLLTRKLIELIAAGLAPEEICSEWEKYRKHTHLLFLLESMDNLVKNGRVSKLKGVIAGVLKIKVLGAATEAGTVGLLYKPRGRISMLTKALEEMFLRGFQGGRVIISHCFNQESVQHIKDALTEKFPHCDILVTPTSGLCSYYAENKGLLIGFEDIAPITK